MVRSFVALIDQGVRAVNSVHPRIVFGQWRQVWIVFPKIGKWRPHIRDKSPRMTAMQVADRGSEHDNISGRKAAFEQQLAHDETRSGASRHHDSIIHNSAVIGGVERLFFYVITKRMDAAWAGFN